MTTIVRDDDIRSGTPHIDGTRVTVLDCKRRVIDQEEDPHVVAGEYDISMAELFTALAEYYEHRDEFTEQELEFATARREGEQRVQELITGTVESTKEAD